MPFDLFILAPSLTGMKITFDFEKPLAELEQQIEKVKQMEDKNKLDMSATVNELQAKLDEARTQIYGNLNGGKKYKSPVTRNALIRCNTWS